AHYALGEAADLRSRLSASLGGVGPPVLAVRAPDRWGKRFRLPGRPVTAPEDACIGSGGRFGCQNKRFASCRRNHRATLVSWQALPGSLKKARLKAGLAGQDCHTERSRTRCRRDNLPKWTP